MSEVSYRLTTGAAVETMSTTWHAGTDGINLAGNELANAIYGNEGANVLEGLGGDDLLVGGGGADTLIGLDGLDVMAGGLGNDTYIVSDASDIVREYSGEGDGDFVMSEVSYRLTAGAAVEVLSTAWHAGTAAINLAGNELANSVYGNDGANVLEGLAGNDVIGGGFGDDLVIGGAGNDTLSGDGGEDGVVLSGLRGDYTFVDLGGGSFRVTDNVAGRDGVDVVSAVEWVVYGDGTSGTVAAALATSAAAPTVSSSSIGSTMVSSDIVGEWTEEDDQGFVWSPPGGDGFGLSRDISNGFVEVPSWTVQEFGVSLTGEPAFGTYGDLFGGSTDDFVIGSATSLGDTVSFRGDSVQAISETGGQVLRDHAWTGWKSGIELVDGIDDLQNPADDYFLL
jgi:Ca2+-binding RTX toxin-like protein